MRTLHRCKVATILLAGLLVLVAGCAGRKSGPKNYTVFPPPPDEPRIQYLWSFGAESDLGGRGAFADFVVGSEGIYRPIIKPYGVAIRNGKVYVCDTQAANISISDLRARRLRYVKPTGQSALKVPVNIAVDKDGLIYVTDTGRQQLLVFDEQGNLLEAIGQKDEMKPCGLFVTDDRIYITDLMASAVRVYERVGRRLLFTFPAKEEDSAKRLYQPSNVTVDKAGRIIVSDTGGFAVKIFDSQGKHLQTFGELGVTPGQFALPKGIGADHEGRIYVVDAAAPVVQLFDEKGRLLMYFGMPSTSGPAGLYLPAGLTIDYENVGLFQKYVAPGQQLEYLILLTNQVGPKKVSVYGFLKKKS